MIPILNLSTSFTKTALSFDKNYFNSLPPFSDERNSYLSFFKKIGIGSTRETYALSSKKALKVAIDKYGLEENRNEYNILSTIKSKFLPKFFDSSKDYSWIEVELVRTLSDRNEIEELIGVNGKDLIFIMGARKRYNSLQDLLNHVIRFTIDELNSIKLQHYYIEDHKIYDIQHCEEKIKRYQLYLKNSDLFDLDKLLSDLNLKTTEFIYFFNFGKSASGNLVILDLGKLR